MIWARLWRFPHMLVISDIHFCRPAKVVDVDQWVVDASLNSAQLNQLRDAQAEMLR